jgi:hypothetical protein
MPKDPQSSQRATIVFGLISAAIGAYYALGGAGLFPLHGEAHAPGWIIVCAGLVFLIGGLAVAMQALGGVDEAGELPPDAPAWMKLAQQLAALAIVGSLATLGTWVAFFGESEGFSVNGAAATGIGVTFARAAFALGSLATWLFFLALARRSVALTRQMVTGGRTGS